MKPKDAETDLTQGRLKSLLRYDAETGDFVWRIRRTGGIDAGDKAGFFHTKNGHRRIKIDGKLHYAHRLAWLYMTGEWPRHFIDHIDLSKANNAWSNLRGASHSDNIRNRRAHKNSASGLKGAYLNKARADCAKPWRSSISVNGCVKYLGSFTTAEEANVAYANAATVEFGEFARS